MSKVYSFRLDENNPREAQAKDVIDAWVSKGYSLRRIIIDALISYHREGSENGELEEILDKITQLFEGMNRHITSSNVIQETLPKSFVNSKSRSVKKGIRM